MLDEDTARLELGTGDDERRVDEGISDDVTISMLEPATELDGRSLVLAS